MSKRDQAALRRIARGLQAEEVRALASPDFAAQVEQSRREVEALRAARYYADTVLKLRAIHDGKVKASMKERNRLFDFALELRAKLSPEALAAANKLLGWE